MLILFAFDFFGDSGSETQHPMQSGLGGSGPQPMPYHNWLLTAAQHDGVGPVVIAPASPKSLTVNEGSPFPSCNEGTDR